MQRINKVVTRELGQRMKDLGWEHETERRWYECSASSSCHKTWWTLDAGSWYISQYIPAPDAIEIGVALPDWQEDTMVYTFIDCGTWFAQYREKGWGAITADFNADTEAEARGLLWCYLKEKGLV